MTRLAELASLIRSKNAGPFELTFDIMFDDAAVYERVKASGCLSASVVSSIYRVPEDEVKFFLVDNALAIKFTIPRPIIQGDPFDTDSHGGQQYPPLMDIDVA
jgi:hypothetical protein